MTAKEIEKVESEEEEVETEEVETEESEDTEDESTEDEEESESEDDKSGSSTDELDIDAELEKERGVDSTAAEDAFKKREEKRKGTDSEGDKPLTKKELEQILAEDRKDRVRDQALQFAKGMAGSEKEAELIVAKWSNRTFPKSLTLKEQIEEAYAITHSKKLIGERNEAMRALRGKETIKKDGADSHRDSQRSSTEPKLPPSERMILRQSGFTWNDKSRQYEKKLSGGRVLIRDTKTKQVKLQSRVK